jgi:sugar lactone lactonase YvrE
MTLQESLPLRRCLDFELGLGEGPVWDARSGALLFVDIPAPALFRYHPDTSAVERWEMPEVIGSFGLCPDGRVVLGLRSGVFLYDLATRKLDLLARPEPNRPGNRLNDGKVGPDGAFWVGSMDDAAEKGPNAALHRITADGQVTTVAEGLTISNGLAWSPDGRTMFHSDSRQTIIWTWDFDPATGEATNRREIRRLTSPEGRPDGAAADAEGCYWSAGVSAGCLNRFAPDGTLLRRIDLPILAPTMPCFGGPDLRTVYLTSLSMERDGRSEKGGLYVFETDLGVAGAPVARFGEPLL